MYDFHKVKQENDNLVFKNPLFKKIVSTQAYRTDKVFQINATTSETKLVIY